MPLAFVAFLASGAAFAFWGPFAAPVGTDIAGGLRSELSGPDRLLLDGGRAVFLGATAAMATALFLGGGAGPVLPDTAWYVQIGSASCRESTLAAGREESTTGVHR